jgi:hypothetical protein
MLIIGLLNVGSLFLGLIAWGIPIVFLVKKPVPRNFFSTTYSTFSFLTCTLALLLQLMEQNYRITANDWAALLDLSDFVVFVSTTLVLVTIILNMLVARMVKNSKLD